MLQHSLETLIVLMPVCVTSATFKWCGERMQDVLVVRPEGWAQQAADILGDDSLRPDLADATEQLGPEIERVVITLVHPCDAPRLAWDTAGYDVNCSMPAGKVH